MRAETRKNTRTHTNKKENSKCQLRSPSGYPLLDGCGPCWGISSIVLDYLVRVGRGRIPDRCSDKSQSNHLWERRQRRSVVGKGLAHGQCTPGRQAQSLPVGSWRSTWCGRGPRPVIISLSCVFYVLDIEAEFGGRCTQPAAISSTRRDEPLLRALLSGESHEVTARNKRR